VLQKFSECSVFDLKVFAQRAGAKVTIFVIAAKFLKRFSISYTILWQHTIYCGKVLSPQFSI
jgi:hypothetical protein